MISRFPSLTRESIVWTLKQRIREQFRVYGVFGILLSLLVLGVIALGVQRYVLDKSLTLKAKELAALPKAVFIPSSAPADSDNERLKAFDHLLLAYDDLPDNLQVLFTLAEKETLLLQRGEYKKDLDVRGEFLRFRMALPVKGNAQDIYHFIIAALQAQPALALESIQFKRERSDSKVVEVGLHWVLLSHPVSEGSDKRPLATRSSGEPSRD